MNTLVFYDAWYVDDAACGLFEDSNPSRRGIQLEVNGAVIVDAWLDEGEDPKIAEQALRDMCVLRQGSA